MNKHSPVWKEGVDAPDFPALSQDIQTDIAIIGGGITGVTAAYLLAKAGKKVVLLEKNSIGAGETSHTTAFLTYPVDVDLSELVSRFGEIDAGAVWGSMQHAIDAIEQIVKEEEIDCGFMRCPLYVYPHDRKGKDLIQREYAAAKQLGFPVSLSKKELGSIADEMLVSRDNAKFHPLRYLYELSKKAEQHNAAIYQDTEVLEYHGNNPATLVTTGGTVSANTVIIATHTPNNLAPEAHSRLLPMQTYVIAATIPKGAVEEALYINTKDPYHYIRIDNIDAEYDRILLGGEDHQTGKMPKDLHPYDALARYLKELLGNVPHEISHGWSG